MTEYCSSGEWSPQDVFSVLIPGVEQEHCDDLDDFTSRYRRIITEVGVDGVP